MFHELRVCEPQIIFFCRINAQVEQTTFFCNKLNNFMSDFRHSLRADIYIMFSNITLTYLFTYTLKNRVIILFIVVYLLILIICYYLMLLLTTCGYAKLFIRFIQLHKYIRIISLSMCHFHIQFDR